MNGDDIRFWTTLLKVTSVSDSGLAILDANCTHVTGDYWIMEGDVDYLRDEGIGVDELAEGAVGSLHGLGEQELRAVCWDSYRVRIP